MNSFRLNRRGVLIATTASIPALLLCSRTIAGTNPTTQAAVGKAAPAFEVIDVAKNKRSLSEFKGKTVVLEWTSPSCPFAKAQYDSGKMQELQKWSARNGMVWLSVLSSHPSRSDYLEPAKAETFNRARGASPTALLIDASGDVGHAYGAKTANHMFVVDRAGVLIYAGGIDDAETMDAKKVLRARNWVRAALDDVLAGRAVKVSTTAPSGCALAYAG
jgi:peroxiredoxin